MGNPHEHEILINLLKKDGYKTHSFYLTGHNKRVNYLTRQDWYNDCTKNIEYLIKNNHENFIIVGHSMGGVLGIDLALRYEKYVKKIILFNPALEYLIRKNGRVLLFQTAKQLLKAFKQIDLNDGIQKPAILPINAAHELKKMVIEHRNDIYKIKCPILILQGDEDHVVPSNKIYEIYEELNNKNKEFIAVSGGSHWFIRTKKIEEIYPQIKSFLDKGKN